MKAIITRVPDELHQQLTEYAKEHELSMNQVVKMALRLMMQDKPKFK